MGRGGSVPPGGRGEGLNGAVVAERRGSLLVLATRGAHIAPRRLVTSYVREGWLFEDVMVKVMLRSAGYASWR